MTEQKLTYKVDDGRWDVDTIADYEVDSAVNSVFNDAFYLLACGYYRDKELKYVPEWRDFIRELVGEIERLQTELIEKQGIIERLADELSDYDTGRKRATIDYSRYTLEAICSDAGWFEVEIE